MAQVEVSENVVDLLLGMLGELPEPTLVLRLAAAGGQRFSAGALALAGGLEVEQVARDLRPALERGLVVPSGQDCRLLEFGGSDDAWYRFAHERVQEAAYQLI